MKKVFRDGSVMESHSPEGDRFIQGWGGFYESHEKSRQLFLSYLGESRSILYWHIHDGWLSHKYKSGSDVLNHDSIGLTWIDEHAGWSHTHFKPKDGELIAIIEDSPDGCCDFSHHTKPFPVHIFEAKRNTDAFGVSVRYTLNRVETVTCIFENGKYIDYKTPLQKTISKLKRLFNQ